MSQRFEGRNLEEALTSAAETLGVERYQLTYHVLIEKRGFLGGMKRVVIEAEVNASPADAPIPEAQAVAPSSEGWQPREPHAREPRREGRQGGGAGRGGGGGRGRGGGSGGRGGGRGFGGRERGPDRNRNRDRGGERPRDREQVAYVAEDAPEQTVESDAAQAVRAWFEEVLDLTDLELDIRTTENEEQIFVQFYGRDGGKLLDHHGELLDSFQVLVNKSLTGRKVEKDIEVDCQKFKERRALELGQKARETAERVRRDGREQLLPAMSPIERRIVHLALQDDAEVSTESRGDGFFKRVAIILRQMPPAESPAGEP